MSNLVASFAFVGRIYAIRCALRYDLSDLPQTHFAGPGARLWRSHMAAWKAASL